MRDAEGIGRDRKDRRRLDHLVVVNPSERRARADVFQFSSTLEEHAVERSSGFADVELTRQGILVHDDYHADYATRLHGDRPTLRQLRMSETPLIKALKTNNLP